MSLLDAYPTSIRTAPPAQFLVLTIVSIVFLLLGVAWSLVDARQVVGAAVWMKPVKFALSFVVFFATIALVEARLSETVRDGWLLRVIAWVMAAAFLPEMAYMTYQAALAKPSHFNTGTPFHAFMYQAVMASGAVALVLGAAVIGVIAKRDRSARLGDGLRTGIFLGFPLTFVLTMVTAGYLSTNGGHFVGLHPEGAAVLPLLGWSGVTGDLRPAHFAAMHAMQVLPLLGLWLDRRSSGSPTRILWIGSALYGGLTMAVFAQALMGMPLLPLGSP
jgi:hypothetical protein